MPTREELDQAKSDATGCIHSASELEILSGRMAWPAVRELSQILVPFLADTKPRLVALEAFHAAAGFPGLPGVVRAIRMKPEHPEPPKLTAHMAAFLVLQGIVVRIDKGGLVTNSPSPVYDRDKPVVVELPVGFETLREWIEKEAALQV